MVGLAGTRAAAGRALRDRPGGGEPEALAVAARFVGRQAELDTLEDELRQACNGQPRVVRIQGPSGIGKSALVDRFLRHHPDLQVLRASGDEAEAHLPYGLVEQLSRVAGADLLAEDNEEPVRVGMRLLALIDDLESRGALVLVVDDAHWADPPSLTALIFALRRLVADQVLALILVADDGVAALPDSLRRLVSGERGSALRLGGLEVGELRELAAAAGIADLPVAAARRLRADTDGNPMHALALLEESPPAAWNGAGGGPLPPPRSFALLVHDRWAACSPQTRRFTEAAAVLGMRAPLATAVRLAGVGDPLHVLDEASKAGLVRPAPAQPVLTVEFAHRLIRSAIYQGLPVAERARLHGGAAALTDDEGAALRHRAAAATGPDADLARTLDGYARREAAREAWRSAAGHLVTASRLSPDPAESRRRLLAAVNWMLLGGDAAGASGYAATIAGFPPGPDRDSVLGYLATMTGEAATAERLLGSAWAACDPAADPELAATVALQYAWHWVGRLRGDAMEWGRRAADLAPAGDPRRAVGTTYMAYGLAFAGRLPDALDAVDGQAGSGDPVGGSPRWWLQPRSARGWLRLVDDDLAGARADLAAVAAAALDLGILNTSAFGLAFLARAEYVAGAWDDAVVHAERAVAVNAESDNGFTHSAVLGAASAVPAARGDWATAEAYADAATRLAGGYERSTVAAALARAQVAAARGEHAGVIAALGPVHRLRGTDGAHEPGCWPWQDLYAEALVGAGRAAEAADFLAPHEELAARRGRRSMVARLARARGRVAAAQGDRDRAEAAFALALNRFEGLSMPFEQALTLLAYGQFLRRAGSRRAAVTALMAARGHLVDLDAVPYQERCDRELAAAGLSPARRGTDGTHLTSQERAVARLVASGHTNRETAAELVVSVKTVEFHLRNVYQKLGISSRGQLKAALSEA
jgi:DNA-binding CsgD family transcriptional regulator